VVDAYDESAVAPSHLDAIELDATEREMRLFDARVYTKPVADESGRPSRRAGRAPDPKANHERQRHERRYHPCASLAEEPQHRLGIMPRLKREA
jgi:hypothetical protein